MLGYFCQWGFCQAFSQISSYTCGSYLNTMIIMEWLYHRKISHFSHLTRLFYRKGVRELIKSRLLIFLGEAERISR